MKLKDAMFLAAQALDERQNYNEIRSYQIGLRPDFPKNVKERKLAQQQAKNAKDAAATIRAAYLAENGESIPVQPSNSPFMASDRTE